MPAVSTNEHDPLGSYRYSIIDGEDLSESNLRFIWEEFHLALNFPFLKPQRGYPQPHTQSSLKIGKHNTTTHNYSLTRSFIHFGISKVHNPTSHSLHFLLSFASSNHHIVAAHFFSISLCFPIFSFVRLLIIFKMLHTLFWWSRSFDYSLI